MPFQIPGFCNILVTRNLDQRPLSFIWSDEQRQRSGAPKRRRALSSTGDASTHANPQSGDSPLLFRLFLCIKKDL